MTRMLVNVFQYICVCVCAVGGGLVMGVSCQAIVSPWKAVSIILTGRRTHILASHRHSHAHIKHTHAQVSTDVERQRADRFNHPAFPLSALLCASSLNILVKHIFDWHLWSYPWECIPVSAHCCVYLSWGWHVDRSAPPLPSPICHLMRLSGFQWVFSWL